MRALLAVVLALSLAPAQETYLLCVGVEQYDDARVAPLRYAAADARAIAASFRAAGVPSRNIVVLTTAETRPERRPTRNNLLTALEQLRERAAAADRAIIFFAGHGVEQEGEQYLLSVDTRSTLLRATSLPMSLVNEALQGLQASELLFMVDACRNDPSTGRALADATLSEGLARGLRPQLAGPGQVRPPRVATLLACDVGQRAWEDPDTQHGVFTRYLLRGLGGEAAGADGRVHLEGLARYVAQGLRDWCQRHGREQAPKLLNPDGGDMVLLVPPAEPMVSVSLAQQPLAEVVRQLAEEYGAQIVLGEGVDGGLPVTGRLEAQPLSAVLKILVAAHQLRIRRDGPAFVIEARAPAVPAAPATPAVPAAAISAGGSEALTMFPVGIWVRNGPAKDEADLVGYWRRVLTPVAELGFDTIVALPTTELYEPALDVGEALGLKVVVCPYDLMHAFSAKVAPTEAELLARVREAAAVINRHRNVIGWIVFTDPVEDAWLDRWRVVGPAMAAACPQLPGGLACYWSASQLARFDSVSPTPVYQAFQYNFRQPPGPRVLPCIVPQIEEVRTTLSEHRCWPWIQAFTGWDCQPVNADQLRASCLVGLADGIRGYTFALWGRPEPAVAGLCDAEFRPTPLARQIAGFLPRLKKLGTLLAPCRRIEIAARVGGRFVEPEGGLFARKPCSILVERDDVLALLDTYVVSSGKSSTAYTRCRADYVLGVGPAFRVYREGVLSTLGKALGTQDVTIGIDPAFDEHFMVKADDEAKVLADALTASVQRRLLAAHPKSWLQSDGKTITLTWYGLERDADKLHAALELVSEAARFGVGWLEVVRAVPDARSLPARATRASRVLRV
ncbi:MAG: caspase family protein, partial [Armatimonadetes bacterium]|nr:caspase family protein [Armatimonadota bacterium]